MDEIYRKISNIKRTLVENKINDHSDVVGAALWTNHLCSVNLAKTNARRNEQLFSFQIWCGLYNRFDGS